MGDFRKFGSLKDFADQKEFDEGNKIKEIKMKGSMIREELDKRLFPQMKR